VAANFRNRKLNPRGVGGGGVGGGGGTLASHWREWMDPQNIVLISHP